MSSYSMKGMEEKEKEEVVSSSKACICRPVILVTVTVVTLAVVGVVAAVVVLATRDDGQSGDRPVNVEEAARIDCYPEARGGVEVADEASCLARNCTWQPPSVDLDAPACYVPTHTGLFGFRNVTGPVETTLGYQWELEPINEDAIYEKNFPTVYFYVEFRADHLVRFKFDVPGTRFKVENLFPLNLNTERAPNPVYEVDVYKSEPFAFRIIRSSTDTAIWDTGVGGLVFSDQFLQIATRLPSDRIYGMGENLHYRLKHDLAHKTWPLWSRDQGPHTADNVQVQNMYNLYSVHPFYECVEKDGNAHGVLLYNSNAMDYTLTPLPMLVYKTIGGILDFYVFLGPTAENVVQQYTEVVGRPYMPPYWMLGFQLCRYGYRNVSMMQDSLDRTIAYDIPVDILYADIDHMEEYRIFTVDMKNFGGLKDYFNQIRDQGMHTIIILDPCIEINDTYKIYTDGLSRDIYIKWPSLEDMPPGDFEEYNRTDMMGTVWPNWKVVFPDFFLNETSILWSQWIRDFRLDQVPFDAVWLDMNEVANFDTNGWRPWNWDPEEIPTNWTLKCPNNSLDDPPYRTMAAFMYDNVDEQKLERLSIKTLCLQGVQGEGAELRQYDVHSLYGHKQASVTLQSVRAAMDAADIGKMHRSMLVTRSTFVGSGAVTGRWLGDNSATWLDLRVSIIGLLEFNIMGFPYIGADICGFFQDTTPELCQRWHELGAFYPYSRNHNHEEAKPQDPGWFGDEVALPTRDVLRVRYTLLPYLYTLFHHAHTRGDTVIRPLFHAFPLDDLTYSVDTEFLWGPALFIIPILEPASVTNVRTWYAPAGRWYNYYTSEQEYHREVGGDAVYTDVTRATPIQLLIRGGYIIPTQQYANNTHFSRQNPFGLKVALHAENGEARGDLFWDDGDSVDTYESDDYVFIEYVAANNFVNGTVIHPPSSLPELDDLVLGTVEVLGVVLSSDPYLYVNNVQHNDTTYNADTEVLNITGLNLPMGESFYIMYSETPLP